MLSITLYVLLHGSPCNRMFAGWLRNVKTSVQMLNENEYIKQQWTIILVGAHLKNCGIRKCFAIRSNDWNDYVTNSRSTYLFSGNWSNWEITQEELALYCTWSLEGDSIGTRTGGGWSMDHQRTAVWTVCKGLFKETDPTALSAVSQCCFSSLFLVVRSDILHTPVPHQNCNAPYHSLRSHGVSVV